MKEKYLLFKEKKCPHCGRDLDIEISYEVVDRFQVDYEATLSKSECDATEAAVDRLGADEED